MSASGKPDGTLPSLEVNGRTYALPDRPVAVICIDGCADEYLSTSIVHDCMPNVARIARDGYRGMARGALPSFTNVNNCAIVTGTAPNQTGMAGNYIIDPDTGEEVMTNSSKWLRNETILAAAADTGRKVAMVTAKDKLREMLAKNMHGIGFSSEKAGEATEEEHGIGDVEALFGPAPHIYSPKASIYVLHAGAVLIERGLADFCYLSLTDYMQHTYAPDTPESLDFHAAIDVQIGRLLELGCIVGITADHGMNGKTNEAGEPNVIYLETVLNETFGKSHERGFRVICPITDPHVTHHGALGSAVTVYLPNGVDVRQVAAHVLAMEGIHEVYTREQAVAKLELPPDRIGDLFVMSNRDWVVGRAPEHHDLSALHNKLRSHGGRYEEMVPLLISEPLNETYKARAAGDPRNFDIFDFVCNGTVPQDQTAALEGAHA